MRKIRIVYIKTEKIAGELYHIYIDFQTLHFIAILRDDVYKDVHNDAGASYMKAGAWASFESFENLKEGITDWAESLSEEYEPTDPENKHWENVATYNERFSHD